MSEIDKCAYRGCLDRVDEWVCRYHWETIPQATRNQIRRAMENSDRHALAQARADARSVWKWRTRCLTRADVTRLPRNRRKTAHIAVDRMEAKSK